ncbi:hypothetical protein [Paenibacillus arenilitoris]|uniref:Uncharacterized protein n=1 Tax=Paenibacillus arenilitoris TaxID=2772299 RepID=A0A927CIV4_9BACL|nr:hypothetical protein [Paenibacillus arenilitoris]MBD2867897.1 hypothetical protein [Paenibacillus arenilitoris]
MRQPYWKAIITFAMMTIIAMTAASPVAEAGFFDRVKDIYNTPDKISELEAQYLEAQAALAEQQRQMEASLAEAERRQRELMQQNEQLMAQNASLQAEMEQMKQDRGAWITRLIQIGVIVAVLLIAYILSIRIWRYVVWRKQRAAAGGQGLGG